MSCLHAQSHFHRDLKPENVMFDESYNVKARILPNDTFRATQTAPPPLTRRPASAQVTDFGACAFAPVADVLQQPRAMTGIHCDPNDDRMWCVWQLA